MLGLNSGHVIVNDCVLQSWHSTGLGVGKREELREGGLDEA